jgi:hypothetical protein
MDLGTSCRLSGTSLESGERSAEDGSLVHGEDPLGLARGRGKLARLGRVGA